MSDEAAALRKRVAALEALTLDLLKQFARLAEAFPDAAWTLRCPHGAVASAGPCELCGRATHG